MAIDVGCNFVATPNEAASAKLHLTELLEQVQPNQGDLLLVLVQSHFCSDTSEHNQTCKDDAREHGLHSTANSIHKLFKILINSIPLLSVTQSWKECQLQSHFR